MAKRSKDVGRVLESSIELGVNVVEPDVVLGETIPVEPVAFAIVRLRLMRDVKLTTVGKVTGTQYQWSGAGAEIDVYQSDVETLLQRGVYKSCCGSVGTPYFEIV